MILIKYLMKIIIYINIFNLNYIHFNQKVYNLMIFKIKNL